MECAPITKHFANQGGDPYLYELYSRFNAADFQVGCRLLNTIGRDEDARKLALAYLANESSSPEGLSWPDKIQGRLP